MATIRFPTNVPAGLRLRHLEGRPVERRFGGMRPVFSAEAGAACVSHREECVQEFGSAL